jgi:ABC-type dipeptide/oligopeptide/nickel transport system ATPase component
MGLVLQHPAFKANPFATIQQHLKNTLATQAKEQEITSEQRRTKEAQELVKKKEVKKERKIDLQLRRKPRGQHHSRPGSNQRTTRR